MCAVDYWLKNKMSNIAEKMCWCYGLVWFKKGPLMFTGIMTMTGHVNGINYLVTIASMLTSGWDL